MNYNLPTVGMLCTTLLTPLPPTVDPVKFGFKPKANSIGLPNGRMAREHVEGKRLEVGKGIDGGGANETA